MDSTLTGTFHRWATEDPNPVQKVAEKRRIEEIGQKAIASKLDPRMVDAVRAIRALEDGEEIPEEYSPEDEEDVDDQQDDNEQQPKRRRIEEVREVPTPNTPLPPAMGMFSAETIEGLKYFAEIRKARGADITMSVKSAPRPTPKGVASIGGLGDYGSDEESD